jgi:hypothetical protein
VVLDADGGPEAMDALSCDCGVMDRRRTAQEYLSFLYGHGFGIGLRVQECLFIHFGVR